MASATLACRAKNDDLADAYLSVFAALMFQQSESYPEAGLWYERALSKLGNDDVRFPWNLHLKYGGVLVAQGLCTQALPHLIAAQRHPSFDVDNASVYHMLAICYEATGSFPNAFLEANAAKGSPAYNEKPIART